MSSPISMHGTDNSVSKENGDERFAGKTWQITRQHGLDTSVLARHLFHKLASVTEY